MPVSKVRKKRPVQPAAAINKPPSPPPAKTHWWWWGWLKWIVGALGGAVAVASTIIGLLALLPAVTIEPANAPEASNPFSGAFKVANSQFYPLWHVRIDAYLWCVRMGTGTDTSRPSFCEKGNIPSSMPAWNQDIASHGSREIVAGEVLYGTPRALLYAEISIKVTYQPWYLPISLEREDHFYTRRKDNGDIEWLSK
jgi:hypothetical protein